MMKNTYLIFGLATCLSFLSCQKKEAQVDNGGDTQLNEGLIAYYPFNGNVNDETGNGYHLSVNGATTTANRFGELQRAYKFNGSSDFMIIPKILKGDSLREMTISVWVNTDEIHHNSILSFLTKKPHNCSSYIGFDNGYGYSLWSQMTTHFTGNSCSAIVIRDTIDSPLNKWCHIVLTQRYSVSWRPVYDYAQYYNGKKLKGTQDFPDPDAICFSEGGIIGANNAGYKYDYNYDFFKGSIDDMRIYNRALSDEEVAQLYKLRE